MRIGLLFQFTLLSILLLTSSCLQDSGLKQKQDESDGLRIISLSGFLTETLFELGYGENIVGCDITSTYPVSVSSIPKLGHISQLNIEAILQLNPDYIFVEKKQLQQATALSQLSDAGIKVISIPTTHHLNNTLNAIQTIDEHLKIQENTIIEIKQNILNDSMQLLRTLRKFQDKPKVLFIYARGAGNIMVAGNNTAAAAIIEKAGGQNAVQSFENYRALTPEALIETAPDVILMLSMGLESLNGKSGLEQITGISQTPAFKNDRIIAMEGHYLTAFGPRAAQAAIELAEKIHSN